MHKSSLFSTQVAVQVVLTRVQTCTTIHGGDFEETGDRGLVHHQALPGLAQPPSWVPDLLQGVPDLFGAIGQPFTTFLRNRVDCGRDLPGLIRMSNSSLALEVGRPSSRLAAFGLSPVRVC